MQGRGGRFEGMRNEGKKYIARKILEDKLAPNLYFEFDLRQKKKNNWKFYLDLEPSSYLDLEPNY